MSTDTEEPEYVKTVLDEVRVMVAPIVAEIRAARLQGNPQKLMESILSAVAPKVVEAHKRLTSLEGRIALIVDSSKDVAELGKRLDRIVDQSKRLTKLEKTQVRVSGTSKRMTTLEKRLTKLETKKR